MTIYKFAGFWRRLIACVIDCAIIFTIFLVLFMIAGFAFFAGTMSAQSSAWITQLTDPELLGSKGMILLAFYTLLFVAYFTYFHGLDGRTPGKKLLGLQVISADGMPISFGIAFLRSVGYLVSSLLFTLPLGYVWTAFDKKKQGWHDKIAGTVVIIREPDGDGAGISIPDSPAPEPDLLSGVEPSGIVSQAGEHASGAPSGEEAARSNDQKIP